MGKDIKSTKKVKEIETKRLKRAEKQRNDSSKVVYICFLFFLEMHRPIYSKFEGILLLRLCVCHRWIK